MSLSLAIQALVGRNPRKRGGSVQAYGPLNPNATDRRCATPGDDGTSLHPLAPTMLAAALALLVGGTAPALAVDPETGIAIFQDLLETAPGEFQLRSLSLSAASGPSANASVTTISDPEGQLRMGFTAAAAGTDVDEASLPQTTAPDGWTVETQVGQTVSFPPSP